MECDEYIQHVLIDHLLDTSTYHQLPFHKACNILESTKSLISLFIVDYCQYISPADHQILEYTHSPNDPFAYFSILPKVHKPPWCSCSIILNSGLLCHGLGKWHDQELQPIIKHLPSYLSSSTALKHCLDNLHVDYLHISLFTCDAQSMNTNILTDHTMTTIATYLC